MSDFTCQCFTSTLIGVKKSFPNSEVCRAPTPTPTQTGLDSTTPNIGAGVAIGRGWSLDGAEVKAYYSVTRQFVLILYVDCTALNLTLKSLTMSIEFIYIMHLLVNDRVETTLI